MCFATLFSSEWLLRILEGDHRGLMLRHMYVVVPELLAKACLSVSAESLSPSITIPGVGQAEASSSRAAAFELGVPAQGRRDNEKPFPYPGD